MTIKDIAEMTGLNPETIKNRVREFYPIKMEKGKKTVLTKDEAIRVVNSLKIEPTKKLYVDTNNLQVESNSRLDRLESLVEKLIDSIPLLIKNQSKPTHEKEQHPWRL